MHFTGDVVVGVDGSESSAQAAAWALTELVRGRVDAGAALVLTAVVRDGAQDGEAVKREKLAALRERLEALSDDVEIREQVMHGDPAEQLAAAGEDAALLVIGPHGSKNPAAGRIGTTSRGLPGHALCPAAIQRGEGDEFASADSHPTSGRGVVVGLDTSDYAGVAALDAASYAMDSGEELTVIVGVDALGDAEAIRAQTEFDLTWLRSEFPGLTVRADYRPGDPAQILAEAGAGADLLVIGKRGLGRFAGMSVQLGRTSAQVLDEAQVTVLLVPFRDDERLGRRRLVD
ncbi:universal stress protein [Brevibacterium sp. BRM-1]|uniref:universal stress protein n=1 Tax=Brevibacterium sp. BRM-1 TaxID=2999062 RepID=UPI00227FA4B3|nr:universal stress protein [Brevibacterium sp. BRM-1]WAL39156.1 universal stress protein [Brevibacterium sp. BRM-1]